MAGCPFPGMDPYLEEPRLFPGLHDRLIVYFSDLLQPLVRPRYYVEIRERIYFTLPPERYPDLSLRRHSAPDGVGREVPFRGGGAAVAVAADEPVRLVRTVRERETYLEIRELESDTLVTVLEILSPANKLGVGADQYRDKQAQLLAAPVHLVEVDLLRAGTRVSAAGPPAARLPAFHSLVSVCRADAREQVEVYPFTLRDRLPRVRIPLRRPDADTVLDLPAAFARACESADYALRLPYTQPPPRPELNPEDAAWVREQLAAAGFAPE